MRHPVIAIVIVLLLGAVPGLSRAEQKPLVLKLTYAAVHGGLKTAVSPTIASMPKLGLALAGGGAKAAASIGVLKVLDKEGIPVSFLAGTSMGAGVGGLYAAGLSPDEIVQIFLESDWNNIFSDTPARAFQTQEQKEADGRYLLTFTFDRGRFSPPSGLTVGQKLMNLLAAKTLAASFEADLDFNKLRVPFRAVATDIETGDAVVLDHGLLHEALRASAAIPLVFQPVEIQGRLLVDGGLVNNLPVDVVKSMGADVVIAVDSSAKLEGREQLTSLVDIVSQSVSLQVRRTTEQEEKRSDLVIEPDTSNYSFADFPAIKEIVRRGEEAARAALPRIRELMRPKPSPSVGAHRFRITSLAVRGVKTTSEASIRYAMTAVLSPREATVDDVLGALASVSRLGYFSDVAVELSQEGEGTRATLIVQENPVVKKIQVSGNTIVPTREFLDLLSWQVGKPLNTTRLIDELYALAKLCRNQGFLLTRVERAGLRDDGTLEITMYEGRVDSITLVGQRETKRTLIERETMTRTGTPLNFITAANDIQHLYALDYFESLTVDMTKSPQGGVDLTLKVREKPTTKIRLGLRYDLEDRFTGLTDIVVDNVLGRGIKAYLNTRYGNYTDLTLGYRSPVIIDTYFVHSVQAFYRERHYLIYENKHEVGDLDIVRSGAEISFGYQWFRFGDTYLRYRYATDTVQETFGVNPLKQGVRIGSFAFLSTIDTRDRSVFPRSGMLFKGSYEMAEPGYGSSSPFSKTSLFAQENLPLGERHTVTFEASGGIGSGTLPYEEQFGIGGADYVLAIPLMGYERREFVGRDELGFSLAYRWMIREYQLKTVKALYLNVTGQEANVWNSRGSMSLANLRNGVGVGLHADTIVGPVRLDYGVGEQHRYRVHFSAGFDF